MPAQILTSGELMQADPLDEVRLSVDNRDLKVVGVQVAGEVTGPSGSGVSSPEDDDAVSHDLAPV
jgi:hypothetical protein